MVSGIKVTLITLLNSNPVLLATFSVDIGFYVRTI